MLILKESEMLSIYFLIVLVSLFFGIIIKNKKVRCVAACGMVISMVGLVYLYMPFQVKDLNNVEDVAFYGNELHTHYRERTLTEEQLEKVISYIPDLKLQYKNKEYKSFADAVNAYKIGLDGKDGWTYIYLDYGEPENSFFVHPKCNESFQIDYETAEELLAYLKV